MSETLKGLSVVLPEATELNHLGGNILEGDPFTFCPSVWDYCIDRFAARSVLDIGCGTGISSNYFLQKGLQVIAVDGFDENIKNCRVAAIKHDLSISPFKARCDLVHCHEVAEHIEEEFLDNKILTFKEALIKTA